MVSRLFYSYKSVYKKSSVSQSIFTTRSRSTSQIDRILLCFSFEPLFFRFSRFLPIIAFCYELFSYQRFSFVFSGKDIPQFSVRTNDLISLVVSLRGKSIFYFLERFNYLSCLRKLRFSHYKGFSKNLCFQQVSLFSFFEDLPFPSSVFSGLSNVDFKIIIIFRNDDIISNLNLLRFFQLPFSF